MKSGMSHVIKLIGICGVSAPCVPHILGGAAKIPLHRALDIQLLFLYELECKIRGIDPVYHGNILSVCGMDGKISEKEREKDVNGRGGCCQPVSPFLF